MRKFHCDFDEKEVRPDVIKGTLDFHPVFLILQEQDPVTGKINTLAMFQKEYCSLHKDLVVEEGITAIKEFEKKIEGLTKKSK